MLGLRAAVTRRRAGAPKRTGRDHRVRRLSRARTSCHEHDEIAIGVCDGDYGVCSVGVVRRAEAKVEAKVGVMYVRRVSNREPCAPARGVWFTVFMPW